MKLFISYFFNATGSFLFCLLVTGVRHFWYSILFAQCDASIHSCPRLLLYSLCRVFGYVSWNNINFPHFVESRSIFRGVCQCFIGLSTPQTSLTWALIVPTLLRLWRRMYCLVVMENISSFRFTGFMGHY